MIICDDKSVAALLEGETVMVAAPEFDVGWYLAFRTQPRGHRGGADLEIAEGPRMVGQLIDPNGALLRTDGRDLGGDVSMPAPTCRPG